MNRTPIDSGEHDRAHDPYGAASDRILPFSVDALDARGRVVKLGASIDAVIRRHAYPEPVSRLLAEAAALAVLLGASLKIDGRFQLQTKTDGPVGMIVVDFRFPDSFRAYARFDEDKVNALPKEQQVSGTLLGKGHLALTIDPSGGDRARYQGLVALDGQSLEQAAHHYFTQSEQIPTRVRLAAGQLYVPGADSRDKLWSAGGLLVQFLPKAGERVARRDLPGGDAPASYAAPAVKDDAKDDDSWTEARMLADTIEDHELIDPMLSAERLLVRLFHERGVRAFRATTLKESCQCSRARIVAMLRSFTDADRREMIADDGLIAVTCEFCSARYAVAPDEVEAGEVAADAPQIEARPG
ncbi:molecular chaperone Hsp33 [Rhizobiales bacterium GAS113]|nr:molecular chaperone Hsp33 [Rhizobiales bacterium GAS113]